MYVCLWVCYHDNSKLRPLILQTGFVGIGSDCLQLIKFWPSCTPSKGSAAGQIFLALPYYSQRAVFASPLSTSSYEYVLTGSRHPN